jgi:prepilin-type N-terminal cleavage/methylation domain-containing protein
MMRRLQAFPHERGFTLLELMIALAVGAIMIGAVFTAFIYQNKAFLVEESKTEMYQNVRAALELVVSDLRMAGYGAPKTNMATWYDWTTFTANPTVVQGATPADPDTITFASVLEPSWRAASLVGNEAAGQNQLGLGVGEGAGFNNTDQSVILINGIENAKVRSVNADVLRIDSDPTAGAPNDGIFNDHGAGSEVGLVKLVTYSLQGETLMRDENLGDGPQPVASDIEDFQIQQTAGANGNRITVTLTAKTFRPDASYTHPTEGDNFRRVTVSADVEMRNL